MNQQDRAQANHGHADESATDHPTEASAPAMLRLSDTDRSVLEESDDLRGREVIDSTGEKLGKVSELIVDGDAQQARLLAVEHGGILGIGAEETYIPVDAITAIDEKQVTVDTNRDRVAGAPVYDPEIGFDPPYVQSIYGYYGYTPFFASGYLPTMFPIIHDQDRKI